MTCSARRLVESRTKLVSWPRPSDPISASTSIQSLPWAANLGCLPYWSEIHFKNESQRAWRHRKSESHATSRALSPLRLKGESELGHSSESSSSFERSCARLALQNVASSYTVHSRSKYDAETRATILFELCRKPSMPARKGTEPGTDEAESRPPLPLLGRSAPESRKTQVRAHAGLPGLDGGPRGSRSRSSRGTSSQRRPRSGTR